MAHGRLATLLQGIRSPGRDREEEEAEKFDGPFDVLHTAKASMESLRRRRQAADELNALRRFSYTLDLQKEEEEDMIRRKIQAYKHGIRGAFPLKEVEEKDLRVMHGAFPPDVPAPALMLEPGAGPLGLFVSEVAMHMLRDQGGPPPFEWTFGRRARKAERAGGLPMGCPEPRKIRRGRVYRRWGF